MRSIWFGSNCRFLLGGLCLAASAALPAAEGGNGGQGAEAEIRKVIALYAQGTYEGDAEKLNSVFHPKAVMNGYLGDHPLLATPQIFIDEMQRAPLEAAGTPYRWEVADVRVAGKIASATLLESGFPGGEEFTNYFHLIDDGGGWKIISKLFTQTPMEDLRARLEGATEGIPPQDAATTAQAPRP